MSLRVVVRSSAETDLIESAMFIAEDDPAAAQRFLDEAEKGFICRFGVCVGPVPRVPCEAEGQTSW
jgi:hypothetical protein